MLKIENTGDATVQVMYNVHINSQCGVDSTTTPATLASQVPAEVPVGGATFTLGAVATTDVDFPCGSGVCNSNANVAMHRDFHNNYYYYYLCDDLAYCMRVSTMTFYFLS